MQQRRYQQPYYEAHQQYQQYQPTQNQFHSGNQANAVSYARQAEILQSQLEMEPLQQARHQALMENTSQQERAVPFSNVLQAKATTLAAGSAQKEYQPRFQRSQASATAEAPQHPQKSSSQGYTTQYTANDTRVLPIANSSSLASALTDNSGAKGGSSHPANQHQVSRSNRTPPSTTIDPRQLMHPPARHAPLAPTPQPQRNSAPNMPATIDPRHLLKSSSDFTTHTIEVQSHAPIPQQQAPINPPELLTQISPPALNSSSIGISSSVSDSKVAQQESIRPKTSASSLASNGVSASNLLPSTNTIAYRSNSITPKPKTSLPNVNPFMHSTGASPSVPLHASIPQQQATIETPELLIQTPPPALNSSSIGISSSASDSKAAQQESIPPKTSASSSTPNGVPTPNILPSTNAIDYGSNSVNPKPRTSSSNVNPYIHLTGASPSALPSLNANNRISQSSFTKPIIPIPPHHIDQLKDIVGVWAATAPPNTFFIMPDTGYKVVKTVNRDIVIEIPNNAGRVTPISVDDFVTRRHFYSTEALQLYARRLRIPTMATPVSNGNATVSTFNAETPVKGVVRPTTEVNKKHLARDLLRALGFKRAREDEPSSKPVEQPSAKRQASGEGIHTPISTCNIQAVPEWKRASSSVIMKTEQRAPVADQPISTSHYAMDTRPGSTLHMMQPLQSAPSVSAGAHSLSTSMIDTTISTGGTMASNSKPTAATERASGSGVATSTAHLPPSTSTSKAGSSSASPFTAVTADLGRTVTPPPVEVLAVNDGDNTDEREVEDMVDQLSPITGISILPPPQPMSFSSQYSPAKKVPQTPLFLPSPSSSLPPLNPSSIGGSSTRVSVVPSKGKSVAMRHLTLDKKGKKKQRAYVLIPPPPEYVTKYKAHLMTLELKASHKMPRQGESRQGSTPQLVGRSISYPALSHRPTSLTMMRKDML
ncbi:hypothetical protein BDQ12DRAFT_197454 [Crucibulum laeve]|uniref:Uncharacterized protein n=1 Tax=Crucibulum laeve TaxID=68775 RepID=A0A5C3MGR8_9AGAR|nr:hypothetical protein BDQ12DRAFT_197454 [Crucibulum laeve]